MVFNRFFGAQKKAVCNGEKQIRKKKPIYAGLVSSVKTSKAIGAEWREHSGSNEIHIICRSFVYQ
jgi:hypothetical protein